MSFKSILKLIAKNIAAFLVGSILGLLSTLIIVPIALQNSLEGKSALGAIALIPVLFIIYGILGIVIGGILGIILYNLFRKKKNYTKMRNIYK